MKWSLYALLIGFGMDLILGDPHGFPHPVAAIGKLISGLEKRLRRLFPATVRGENIAGGVLWVLVAGLSTVVPAFVLWGCRLVSPWLRLVVESAMCWQILATKSLRVESMKVYTALETGDVLLAIGNRDVPVGQYTQRIFDYYGLNEDALAHCLTYGSNAKEVTTQVSEGTVDAGILYATDAAAAALEIAGTATPEMCGRVIYPAAVMTCGTNQGAAKDFLDFLRAGAAKEVFERAGFTPLG